LRKVLPKSSKCVLRLRKRLKGITSAGLNIAKIFGLTSAQGKFDKATQGQVLVLQDPRKRD
jgi:hypothetical protein